MIHGAPEIRRTADDIKTVADFATLVRKGEAGKFYCTCGKNLGYLIMSLPNDNQSHVRQCPRCKTPRLFNAAWLFAKMLEANERRKLDLGPALEPGDTPPGYITEVIQPNGRKMIVANPFPAAINATAKRPL